MGVYKPAAVCTRGHALSENIEWEGELPVRCTTCGAKVLTGCPACGQRIRGYYDVPGVAAIGFGYDPPSFCDRCGAAFPWVGRKERIYELQNRLDEENLDPATELELRETLDALAEGGLDEKTERQRWERVKRLAPGFWDRSGVRAVLESVVSAAAKSQLGL